MGEGYSFVGCKDVAKGLEPCEKDICTHFTQLVLNVIGITGGFYAAYNSPCGFKGKRLNLLTILEAERDYINFLGIRKIWIQIYIGLVRSRIKWIL